MTTQDNILQQVRKTKNLTQKDIADLLGMPRTTYAYKEETGSFDEEEKKKIAKFLKIDMTTISWKPSFQSKQVADDKDKVIQSQKEEILTLKAEVKLLKEMIEKLLQNR